MMKKFLATTLLAWTVSLFAAYRFENGPAAITRNGAPFLVAEYGIPEGKRQTDKRLAEDDSQVENLWVTDAKTPFRREIALSADGRRIEIGFQTQVPAYELPVGTPLSYMVSFDLSSFKGGTWSAMPAPARKVEALLGGNIPPSGTVRFKTSNLRGLFLTSANGQDKLVFDFNVEGPSSYASAGINSFAGAWNVTLKDGILTCGLTPKLSFLGALLNSRMLVYDGTIEDWKATHPIPKFTYTDTLQPTALYAFGGNTTGKAFAPASKARPGWSAKPSTVTAAPTGALYSAAKGTGKASFRFGGLTPGLYLVTARFTAYDKPVGPSTATLAGNVFLDGTTIPAGHVAVATRILHLDSDNELCLDGDWQISTLAVQLMLTDTEDFRVRRGFWKIGALWEPAPRFSNSYYGKEPEGKTDIALMPLAPHDYRMPEGYQANWKLETLMPPDTDKNAWRYHSLLGTLGTGNGGTFLELDTPDKIQRRLDELLKTQSRAIIVNGLLARHIAPEMAPVVESFFKTLSPEAHRRGFKIIDHQDFPLLWGAGSGVRAAIPNPGAIQQSVDNATGAWAYCLNNRAYRETYFREILRQIKERDLDGIMIDEVYFMQPNLCGCADCRRQFTLDTGLILPMDETSKDLLARNSALWNAFRLWRIKSVADWHVELRRLVHAIKPEFAIMTYTTHYGWSTTYASMGKGTALPAVARACDYVGTEIMTRNVINGHRATFAFRKMLNSISNRTRMPLFGLVYPQGNYDIAEFGWALNNLANQTTWSISELKQNSEGKPFTAFEYPFDRRFCTPAARIAILYSFSSNYFPHSVAYNSEPLAYGELLNDLGIQYEYILEESLPQLAEKQYDVLLVLNAHNLSDACLRSIRDFAANGGSVYLTLNAAINNEFATPRPQWPFADLFNLAPKTSAPISKAEKLHGAQGDYQGPIPFFRYSPLKGGVKGNVLWSATGRNGDDFPVVFQAPFGKGRIIYSAVSPALPLLQIEQGPAGKYAWNPDQTLLTLARNNLLKEFGQHSTLKYENVPSGVLATLYRENRPGKKPRLVLNLLNATGICLKFGDALTAEAPKGTWTPIARDMTFGIAIPGDFTKATVHAPELECPQPARLEKRADGFRLTLAPGQLPRYAAVIIE